MGIGDKDKEIVKVDRRKTNSGNPNGNPKYNNPELSQDINQAFRDYVVEIKKLREKVKKLNETDLKIECRKLHIGYNFYFPRIQKKSSYNWIKKKLKEKYKDFPSFNTFCDLYFYLF